MEDNIMDRISGYKMKVKGKDENGHWILGEREPLEKADKEDRSWNLSRMEKIGSFLIIIQLITIGLVLLSSFP